MPNMDTTSDDGGTEGVERERTEGIEGTEGEENDPYQFIKDVKHEMRLIMASFFLEKSKIMSWLDLFRMYNEEMNALGIMDEDLDSEINEWIWTKMWRFI